ncbi:MAG TPA: hypothetical protein VE957_04430 [Terriglobales bacterium]|nr:hypothetical protein [Terriglobales bacterium]
MTTTSTTPKIGDKMPNGTIYAGVSSKTGDQLFVPDPDRKGVGTNMTFNDIQEALKNLAEHGHHFRLPTAAEVLKMPFNERSVDERFEWADTKLAPLGHKVPDHALKVVLIPARPPKP